MTPWIAEQRSGFWYCVRQSRLPDAFLCLSEDHAEESARALNILTNFHRGI